MSATIQAPDGRWWWADADTGEVWPCEVRESLFPGQYLIRLTHPRFKDAAWVHASRGAIYDNGFNHPGWRAD